MFSECFNTEKKAEHETLLVIGGIGMLFSFGTYQIDLDIEKTNEFYVAARPLSEHCRCDGCSNYEKAVDFLSQTIINFFQSIGVDVKKPCEVYVNCTNKDGTLNYGGFYHLCGKIITDKSAWAPSGCRDLISLEDNLNISFNDDCSLLEKDFPRPAILLDFYTYVPWVLDKRNPY
jgi:hypothetical protein